MIQTINISLIPSDNKPVINVSQYDNGLRVLRFNIFDDIDMEVPHEFDGETVTCNIRKNDNNIVVITGTIETETTEEGETSYVQVVLTEQACACVGSNYGEISLSSGDYVIGTCNFKLVVERSPLAVGITSQTDIDNLTTQIISILETLIPQDTLINDDIITLFTTWSSKKISDELYALLPVGTASGSIANFNTALAWPLDIDAEFGANVDGVSAVRLGYVDFNQLVKNGNFTDTSNWIAYRSTISATNNELNVEVESGRTEGVAYQDINIIIGHKYFVSAYGKVGTASQGRFRCENAFSFVGPITSSTYQNVSTIKVANTSTLKITLYSFGEGLTTNYKNIICVDLTQMFGENIANYLYSLPDNGLSIIRQLLTKDYYPYNVGGTIVTLDSVNGEPTCPNAVINLGDTYYNGGKVTIDKNGHRTLTADGQTITLPDGQPINALVGDNNVYCDTGDVTVQYKDTVNNYIDTRVNAVSNRSLSMMRTLETLEKSTSLERGETDDQK